MRAKQQLLPFRIFEACESDIGTAEDTANTVHTAAGSTVPLHGAPITAVRVAGLLSTSTAQDVVDFLQGVQLRRGLDSVVLLGDQGIGSRAAIVEVADEATQRLALTRNNELVGHSRFQVVPLTASEVAIFAQASAQGFHLQEPQLGPRDRPQQQQGSAHQQAPSFNTDGSTLKLRGLPYSANITDVQEFLEGAVMTCPMFANSVSSHAQLHTATGCAHVRLSSTCTDHT